MARTVPQVVVAVTPGNIATNSQGAYSEETEYQVGQWVVSEEQLWTCTKVSKKNKPAAGSGFWSLIGSVA